LKQALSCCLLVTMFQPLTGCDSDSRKANARLRREVHDLQAKVSGLEQRDAELRVQLSRIEQDDPEIDSEILSSTPRVMAISLSPYSGVQRTDEDRTTIEVFAAAVDGRNRPLQMVGSLRAVAVAIPADGPPVELGAVSLSPAQVRDAWRNVFGSPSYLIEVPLDRPLPESAQSVHVRVFHEDARTGRILEAAADVRPKDDPVEVE
jgi:hypothetical protein|tara:strand:- start:15839 stop:16456 length:618 start_codon:yes stop_codon:yes gene_type:complete